MVHWKAKKEEIVHLESYKGRQNIYEWKSYGADCTVEIDFTTRKVNTAV
jgi:hypothetical protein